MIAYIFSQSFNGDIMSDVTFTVGKFNYTFRHARGRVLDRQSNSQTSFSSQVSTNSRNIISHNISSVQTDWHSIYILNADTNLEERINFAPNWDADVRVGNDVDLLVLTQVKNQKGKNYTSMKLLNYCFALKNHNSQDLLMGGFTPVAQYFALRGYGLLDLLKSIVGAIILLMMISDASPIFAVFLGIPIFIMCFVATFFISQSRGKKDNEILKDQIFQYLKNN